MKDSAINAPATKNYADVNGIKMYYEINGEGKPLVLIHGGGSTMGTTFGTILPLLAKLYCVIAVDMQNHGHSGHRNEPQTFKQDADDIAELLKQLNIEKADIFGFSNGGQTALEIAIRHPAKVNKLIIASAFYKRAGVPAGFWQGMANAKFSDMPQVYKDEFLKINNDEAALLNMFNKDAQRMQSFTDWDDEVIGAVKAHALIVIGDQDLTLPEHAVEIHRLLSNSRLAILPGNHGSYMGEIMSADMGSKIPEFFVAMVAEFLAG